MELLLFIAVASVVATAGVIKELAGSKKKSKTVTSTVADAAVTITKII